MKREPSSHAGGILQRCHLCLSDGSAILKGCFRRPDNVTLALPFSAVIKNMSVDKCVDTCTERVRRCLHLWVSFLPEHCDVGFLFQEKSLAVLSGDRCHCGYPSPLFSLHEPENEDVCLHRCQGEEFENCGNGEYFVVYQTQVQGNNQPLTPCHLFCLFFIFLKYLTVKQDARRTFRNACWEIPLCIPAISRLMKRIRPVCEFPPTGNELITNISSPR